MQVTMLSWTLNPIQTMAAGALLCYGRGGPEEAWRKARSQELSRRIVAECAASGHGSVIEHASFTFGIESISRACSHQLVRHRIGAFSQQSQRYVNLVEDCWEDGNFVIPPKTRGGDLDSNDVPRRLHEFTDSQLVVEMVYKHLIDLGLSEEDARYVLPNATKTNIIWTTNFRNLIHVCSLRLCKRAQWEIRSVFERIVSLMSGDGALEDHRWMAEFLKPKCQILGYCDEVEGRSCRAMPLKAVVLAAWEKSREEKV